MKRKRAVGCVSRSLRLGDEIETDIVRAVDRAADHLVASKLKRLEGIPLKFLRFCVVRERTGLSRSTIWRLERQGVFPKHRQISSNAVGWLEQEVNDWMQSREQVR